MFDITSSKLLILGVVALLVIGPKDLPALLRTIGRYMGIIKRQAAEFRAQFDEAMRESELEQLKKEVETLGSTTEEHMRAAERSVEAELGAVSGSIASAADVGTGAAVAGERVAAEPTPGEPGPIPEALASNPAPQPSAHSPSLSASPLQGGDAPDAARGGSQERSQGGLPGTSLDTSPGTSQGTSLGTSRDPSQDPSRDASQAAVQDPGLTEGDPLSAGKGASVVAAGAGESVPVAEAGAGLRTPEKSGA
jgi:sec-independent protein translocase protein TatB